MPKKVLIIGGGAAGMFAAMKARQMGADVSILEKNDRLGKKLLITGKGRCNITNAAPVEDIIKNMPGNGKFLHSALHTFSNQDVVETFHRLGVPTKVERGGRVFPASDRAQDVVTALENYIKRMGVHILFNLAATGLVVESQQITGVRVGTRFIPGDAVIIATGGASYPGTGSTGDGYTMAKAVGHTVTPLKPSLVPLETEESWVREVQGLALKNVQVTAYADVKKLGEEFGEMLFTHFGVSGPIILSLSNLITRYLEKHQGVKVKLGIDLKPALSLEQLDHRLQRDFEKYARKQVQNSFGDLLPSSLIKVFVSLLSISPDKQVHQITREERREVAALLKELPVTITKARPLKEAIVTAGGVSVKEIHPKTMESKLIKGLFFAGEVIDVDGYTGGYNLQAAFSTGYLAGCSAAE